MNIPTYYEGLVNDVVTDNNLVTMWLSNEDNGDWYEIYYYGKIIDGYIIATEEASELVIAKSIKSGDEIILFDGAVHGYDNMLWQSHEQENLLNRKSTKLNVPQVKVSITAEYSVDYDSEKDGYRFIDENHIVSDHGKTICWDDLKRNGITWLTIKIVSESGNESFILDAELA